MNTYYWELPHKIPAVVVVQAENSEKAKALLQEHEDMEVRGLCDIEPDELVSGKVLVVWTGF